MRILLVLGLTVSTLFSQSGAERAPVGGKSGPAVPENLADGWKRSIPVGGDGGTYTLWVEGGWLHVRRTKSDGAPEWHVVLAKASGEAPPEIAGGDGKYFRISFRDGKYFLREDINYLRCVREQKDGSWESAIAQGAGEVRTKAGSSEFSPLIRLHEAASWFSVSGGPSENSIDYLLRLNHLTLSRSGYGALAYKGSRLRRVDCGDRWVLDDGEMLVALRSLPSQVEAESTRRRLLEAARDPLRPGVSPPALKVTGWQNVEEALDWKALRGKVVLLDFWATWCGPCVGSLPEVQKLHDDFRKRGLVVVAVHSAQGAETCAPFARKKGLNFPVAVDSGAMERFGVRALPAYFLVDRAGKVVEAYLTKPPKRETIERLLSEAEN